MKVTFNTLTQEVSYKGAVIAYIHHGVLWTTVDSTVYPVCRRPELFIPAAGELAEWLEEYMLPEDAPKKWGGSPEDHYYNYDLGEPIAIGDTSLQDLVDEFVDLKAQWAAMLTLDLCDNYVLEEDTEDFVQKYLKTMGFTNWTAEDLEATRDSFYSATQMRDVGP